MGRVVARSRELLDRRGPGSIGFSTSGQLFLEEYYTLTVIGRAGIGTNQPKQGRDGRLLELVSSCHPQTLRQIRWARTMIKNLSPHVLTSA